MFVDVVIGLVALWAFYTGFKRGIIKTVFTAVGVLLGLLIALKFTPLMAVVLKGVLPFGSGMTPVLAFVVTLFGAILAVRIVVKIFEGILKTVHLNILNRLAGGVLLAGIGVFLLSSLFIFLDRASLLTPEMKTTSILYEYIAPIPELGYHGIKIIFPAIQDMWQNIFELFDQIPVDDRPSPADSSAG